MPLLTHDGITIDYIDEGSGPVVVLLHGSASGNRQWRRLIGELSPHYRCRAPNLLGYGQTSPWPGHRTQTMDDAVAVALAVCELADGPVRLVSTAGAAASRWPRRTHLARASWTSCCRSR